MYNLLRLQHELQPVLEDFFLFAHFVQTAQQKLLLLMHFTLQLRAGVARARQQHRLIKELALGY